MTDDNTPLFQETSTSKIETPMVESTEVVDIEDVIRYNNQFDSKTKTNLVPYVIYMDAEFNNVVRTRKKKDVLFLLFKILGVLLLVSILIFLVSKGFGGK